MSVCAAIGGAQCRRRTAVGGGHRGGLVSLRARDALGEPYELLVLRTLYVVPPLGT